MFNYIVVIAVMMLHAPTHPKTQLSCVNSAERASENFTAGTKWFKTLCFVYSSINSKILDNLL